MKSMKKETIVAITLGILLGLGVAVGITYKNRSAQSQKIKPVTDTMPVTPTPVATQVSTDLLLVESPQSGIIVDSKQIEISGKAQKGGLMVIQSPASTETFQTEKDTISIDFPLAAGENVILVSFYPKDQNARAIEKELLVYSLTEQ